uniref:Ig-like domain-containing protein n=1 Tax=Anabas testudineus TaxID=64144 RepID=A0A7N5ZSV0_ANATE
MIGVSCSLVVSVLWAWTLVRGDTDVSCVFMESCMLPCSFQGGADPVIHWFQLTTRILHVQSYYHNQDQLSLQDQHFKSRTSLFKDQISRGNVSLQLTGVKIQDQGRYRCFTSTVTGDKESFINLQVNAPVNKVDIHQVENNITCSSEGIFPEPELTWSTNPPSNMTFNTTTRVQQTEQQLYNISSSLILSDPGSDVVYSCTISTRRNKRRAALKNSELFSVSGSSRETSVLCTSSNISLTDFSLVWRFNHHQIILNQTNGNQTVSEEWRQHVKSVSESGSLMLQDVTKKQEGTYTCELSSAEETYISNTSLKILKGGQTNVSVIIISVVVAVLLAAGSAALLVYYKYKKTGQEPAVELSSIQNQ